MSEADYVTSWEGSPTKLWRDKPRSSLPAAAVAYATDIMEDLHLGGVSVPLHLKQGYTTQSTIEVIVQAAMDKAVEAYRETRWWRRWERQLTGREWP